MGVWDLEFGALAVHLDVEYYGSSTGLVPTATGTTTDSWVT